MPVFTFTIDTGHAPMKSTPEIAAAMKRVADLIEPWGQLRESGRDVTDTNGVKVGEWSLDDK